MTTKTPNLTEMGVRNPEQIASYTVVHTLEDMDVLTIHYRRPKGSFLPKRRKYEFRRVSKPMPGPELKGKAAIRFDISPILARAITELDALSADGKRTIATKADLQREIAELQADFNQRLAHLSKSIDGLG